MAIRKAPPVSMRRVERKVDELDNKASQLDEKASQLGEKVDTLTARVDAFNPNGTYAALKKLADHSDPLLQLANVAPQLIAAVERDADWSTWWKMTRRIFNPLRPLGFALWTLAIGVAGTVIANHIP